MASLPWEIMVDILSRLTVKDLLRYRSVCKPWCSLIDGPDFIKMHLNRSTETNSNHGVVLSGREIYWVNSDTLDTVVRIDPPPPLDTSKGVEVVGSCNGLLVLMNDKEDMGFWNPSTRRFRKIPIPKIESPIRLAISKITTIGFGYDPINDDYKYFRKANLSFVNGKEESQVKVYSLKAKTWKKINDFPDDFVYYRCYSPFVCNALHWLVTRKTDPEFPASVLAFDLVTEHHHLLSLPAHESDEILDAKLKELGGWLCVVCKYDSNLFDIWAMKEYGVNESWSKLFSIAPSNEIGSFHHLVPLAYLKDGDKVLLELDGGKLLWYEVKGKRVEKVMVSDILKRFGRQRLTYCVESLVGVVGGYREITTVKQAGDENRNEKKMEKQQQSRKKRDGFLSSGFKLVL